MIVYDRFVHFSGVLLFISLNPFDSAAIIFLVDFHGLCQPRWMPASTKR